MVLLLYALIPQLGIFHNSWQHLRQLHPSWVVIAVGLMGLTYAAAALTYCLLALKPLGYRATMLVQLAATFINRLLPGGVGALGINYVYLRRRHLSAALATSTVAINNLLGLIGHGLLVVLVLLVAADRHQSISPRLGHVPNLIWAVSLVAVVALAGALYIGRQRLRYFMRDIRAQLIAYHEQPWRVVAALLSSMTLTTTNVLCLACSALALSVHLPFVALLLIFSFGLGAGAATPTPGGLGGFEAGLVGGLVAYHIGSAQALAVALLYRLISYWLSMAAGSIAFVIARRHKLLTY